MNSKRPIAQISEAKYSVTANHPKLARMFLSPWDEIHFPLPASTAPRMRPSRRMRAPASVPKRPLWVQTKTNHLDFKLEENGRVGFATIKLTRGVRCEDVELDFHEASRTLTLRLGGWCQSFKLPKGFDTTQLEADFDSVKEELRLLAPRLESDTTRTKCVPETDSDEGFASERERSLSPPKSPRTSSNASTIRCKSEPSAKRPQISIEDVGPEEDIDF